MRKQSWAELLWGSRSKLIYLMLAAIVMLFTLLGSRELWTQEHRWADIAYAMMYHHDYLHPTLEGMEYYDKPLLSYWLIVALATVMGKLSVWVLRVPAALAGLLAIWSIYRLGSYLKNKNMGLMAGWMLLTTFYFVFWARTSSADMLNMAGTLYAVTWYFIKKNRPNFINYSVFFLILAITALCKGLVGPVTAVLAILPDLLVKNNWKKHLQLSLVLGLIPAIIVYVVPFWASTHYDAVGYTQNGLYLVYRENILRYFQPFDHKDPIYTYFLYLPIYLLPWTLFFIPALFSLKKRWSRLDWNSKWISWSVLVLFLFFTLSGSRRSYYILPIVPFALLMTAEWVTSAKITLRNTWAGRAAAIFFVALFFNFGILQPFYYCQGNLEGFAQEVRLIADQTRPWSEWKIILLDPESKIRFYLAVPPENKNLGVTGARDLQTHESLMREWPILNHKPANTIFITRALYASLIQNEFKGYEMVYLPGNKSESVLIKHDSDAPVAFIPKK